MSERGPHKLASRLPLAFVAAVGRNGAIGRGGTLPWHMPGDLAHFRDCSMGKPMVMGRRTFASIGRALPGRESIVVSRDAAFAAPPGVFKATTIDAALECAAARAAVMGAPEISVIGGAAVFAELIGAADRLYMTFVDLAPDADTFFPPIDPIVWTEIGRRTPSRHPEDEASCVFVDYMRRGRDAAAVGEGGTVL